MDIPQREHPEVGGYPDASLYTSASDQSGVVPGWPQPTPVDPLREPARPTGPEEGTQGERTVPTIPPLTCWKGPDGQTMYFAIFVWVQPDRSCIEAKAEKRWSNLEGDPMGNLCPRLYSATGS